MPKLQGLNDRLGGKFNIPPTGLSSKEPHQLGDVAGVPRLGFQSVLFEDCEDFVAVFCGACSDVVVESGVLVHPITLLPIVDGERCAVFKFKFKLKVGLVAPVVGNINIKF